MLTHKHIQPRDFPSHRIDVELWEAAVSQHPELRPVDAVERLDPFTNLPYLAPVDHAAGLVVDGKEKGVFLWDDRGRILVEGDSDLLTPISVVLAMELSAVVLDDAGHELKWIPHL